MVQEILILAAALAEYDVLVIYSLANCYSLNDISKTFTLSRWKRTDALLFPQLFLRSAKAQLRLQSA